MDEIHYAGDSVLTGSEIAQALLAYAQALASKEASATVEIPVRHADGSLGRAQFLIGPASQLVTETVETDLEEVVDEQLVASFREAARTVGTTRAMPSYPSDLGEDGAVSDFPDYGAH